MLQRFLNLPPKKGLGPSLFVPNDLWKRIQIKPDKGKLSSTQIKLVDYF